MQIIINTPGTMLKQKDECFRLQNEDKILDIAASHVESIVLSNKAMLTTQSIILALENNIDIIFLDGYGDPAGRVWFSKMGSTALIRRKQLEASECTIGTNLVLMLVKQKLTNQMEFLKKLKYSRPAKHELFDSSIETIQNLINSLDSSDYINSNINELRNQLLGIEGSASRAYFQCISKVMPEKYQFDGRSRRPAKDPFNAVLNYCYGVLYSRVEKACILAGLDPFVGFMHTDNYNKKSLVFDLIEPFRIFAEQISVYLFTGKKARDEFFDVQTNSTSLNQKGKPFVIDELYILQAVIN
ncbi:MAG: CRISPR-associated endonuclease Cas1 [Desulfamplus sp.]|nr:CRISPR-associated endonuclease Cas1 [Desulfamplus sp.]